MVQHPRVDQAIAARRGTAALARPAAHRGGHALPCGLSAPDVQAILGHSSLAVTPLYANTRNDAAKRGAVALSDFYDPQSRGQLEGGEEAAKAGSDLDI